jgi:hypothetical protein
MMNEVLIPALAFGTLLAVLWFGVMGRSAVKKEQRDGTSSALATRDDERDGSTKMVVPSAVDDPNATSRPIRGAQPRPTTPGQGQASAPPSPQPSGAQTSGDQTRVDGVTEDGVAVRGQPAEMNRVAETVDPAAGRR